MDSHAPRSTSIAGAGDAIRSAELLAWLSSALDLTRGLAEGHAARTCWIATRLASRIGLDDVEREPLFH